MASGFFSGLVSRGAWEKEEAFYGILYAAAAADGEIVEQEAEEVRALWHRTKTLRGLGEQKLWSIHRRVEEHFKRDFAAALNDACKSLPTEAANAAFAHATDIVFADGKVVTKEAEFLEALAQRLGIDEARARATITVLQSKNEF